MTRIVSSSFVAIVGLFVVAGSVNLGAQGARARGTAPAQGQAVPRSSQGQAVPSGGADGRQRQQAQAPQTQRQVQAPQAPQAAQPRPGPMFGAAPSVAPLPRVHVPTAGAQPRTTPRVIMPPAVAPQFVRPQVGTVSPNDHPVYRPDYRSDYRSGYGYDNRSDYRRGGYRPSYHYRPPYRSAYRPSYRPYYTFRPRIRLGFGLWIGYPVAYPTYLYAPTPYPYTYAAPYSNAYPYPTGIYQAPGPATTATAGAAGGLSFEITPPEAAVYVDGQYVGTVDQFTPDQAPLALAPGRHHIEIRQPGFEIIAFDVDILPGQVIPYQGDLRRF